MDFNLKRKKLSDDNYFATYKEIFDIQFNTRSTSTKFCRLYEILSKFQRKSVFMTIGKLKNIIKEDEFC